LDIKQDNKQRIEKVKKYIDKNVSNKLPLSELANIANFSPFHFQKLFKSIVKETPKQYIKRIRLEASAHQIVNNINITILEVAVNNGFNSLAAFSRAFKNYYGISPIGFQKMNKKEKNVILQSKFSNSEDTIANSSFFSLEKNHDLEIHITKLTTQKLVYTSITLTDVETIQNAYKKVKRWCFSRNLLEPNFQFAALMLDYPAYTTLEKCRFQTGILVGSKPEVSGDIYYQEIPSRTYAHFVVKGGINELVKSVSQFTTFWLPESGFKIIHIPAIIKPLENPISNHPHDIIYKVYIAISAK